MTRARVLRAVRFAALLLPAAAPAACGDTLDSLGSDEAAVAQGGAAGDDASGAGGVPGDGGLGGTPAALGGDGGVAGAGDAEPPLGGIGVTPEEIGQRINEVYDQLFHGDPNNESVMRWIENDTEAYVLDINGGDIGLDGMGYGMYASAALARREDFDALLAFVQNKMWIRTGAAAGYLSTGCATDLTCDMDATSPDSSSYVVTALLLASRRWASDGGDIYLNMARELLAGMIDREPDPNGVVTDMFDASANLVVYAPVTGSAMITSSGYVMPAFYETWARFDPERADRWLAITDASRNYLAAAPHPQTGLYPWQSEFSGERVDAENLGAFTFESSRVFLHLALDYSWNGADPRQVDEAERALAFFATQGVNNIALRYNIDGTRLAVPAGTSPATTAMIASLGLIAPLEASRPFLQWVWDKSTPTGQYRYYDGMLYLLSLLALGGELDPIR
jgi:oligosaccharide reducing-end xylanase